VFFCDHTVFTCFLRRLLRSNKYIMLIKEILNISTRITRQANIAQARQLADQWAAGHDLANLARNNNMAPNSLRAALKALDNYDELRSQHFANSSRPAPDKFSLTPDQAQTMVDQFRSGVSIRKIAQSIGREASVVNDWFHTRPDWLELRQENVSRRLVADIGVPKGITGDIVQQWVEQYVQGTSLRSLALQSGVAPSTVEHHLRKLPNWTELHNQHVVAREETKQNRARAATRDRVHSSRPGTNLNPTGPSSKSNVGTNVVRRSPRY
jgi:lambda repressor-like predicted transcriptional regulator